MSQSRRERRGKFKTVWDEITKRFLSYRLSKRGKWIMINNLSAQHLSKYQMNKLTNK